MSDWHGVEVDGGEFYSLAGAVSDAALAQLDRTTSNSETRQFFWFHYFDAHGPYGDSTGEGPTVSLPDLHEWAYERPEGFTRKLHQARKLYRADIVNVDRELGRVLDRLAADFPRIATHIVIVADHGESFGERGRLGHGRSLDPVEIHVPLMIVSPDLTAGRRSDPVGSIDVAATLLALGGLRPSLAGGQDLRAEPGSAVPPAAVAGMKARPAADDPVDDSESGDRFFAVIGDAVFEGNSASVSVPAGAKSGEERAAAAVRALFGSFESRLSGVSATRAIDPETERALRALGYLP
jgi:arylsulfatase A-like enzyme